MRRKEGLILLAIFFVFVNSCMLPTEKGEVSELKFEEKALTRLSAKEIVYTEESEARSISAFQSTVYPLLRTKTCAACHGESRVQTPYYLVDDVKESWKTLVLTSKKVDLLNPEASRIYLRLKNENHHCFDGDCDTAAALVLAAIKKWVELAEIDSAPSGTLTSSLPFTMSAVEPAKTEFGTVMLEAEQDNFPEVAVGRFVTDLNGKASDAKFAKTSPPIPNPVTNAARTIQFNKRNNCEVISSSRLFDTVNGPLRISEEATHINTGERTEGTNLEIKNGYRPFSVAIRARLIRPDKRMEYAKRLTGWSNGVASGNADFLILDEVILTNGMFDFDDIEVKSNLRDPGAIDITNITLDGRDEDYLAFRTLPYFTKRDTVFQPAPSTLYKTYETHPGAKFFNLAGEERDLYLLFAPPQNQLSTVEILKNLEVGKFSSVNSDYRKHLIYKMIKERLDAFATSNSPYDLISGMDRTQFFSLYGNLKLNIMACPGGICGPSTQEIEVTTGSDSGGVLLTYQNALDILKVNSSGTGFIAGSEAELAEGKAFRRLDVYAHIYEPGNSRTAGQPFDNIFYRENSTGFSEISRINFPIGNTPSNLNLRALFTEGKNALSKDDNLNNFQATLFPVLRGSSCIGCHTSDQNRPQFTNSSPVVAFDALEDNNFINFNRPLNSFRKVNTPTGPYMVHNCNGTNNNDNASLCPDIEAAFASAISDWNAANEVSKANNDNKTYSELTVKERTPGHLEYEFKITETGYYNIWTKIKSGNGLATNISLRVMDGSTSLITYRGIRNPSLSQTRCVNYTLGDNDTWTWFTPGRGNELANLNGIGEKKLDNLGNPRTIADNRLYWRLEGGKTYRLQIFERAINTQIDLVAIDRVKDHDDILDFQPDLRARDENNISDYKRRVLSYDVSKQLGLPEGSSYFRVEVKSALNGQNYVFRNPRFESPGNNLRVSDIKVFINGTKMFSDSAWTKLNVSTGDNKILTYAPLVTLAENPSVDQFHFSFGVLKLTNEVLSEVDPRGASPVIIDGRKCREIDLFMNTVKPILRNARLIRKGEDGLGDYLNDFPGTRRNPARNEQFYQCMTCHDDTHPYFKMTTFDYPEILCSQALSRVDFDNYRDSLLIRGIDGSGVHPKLFFIEQLQYRADLKSVVDYDPNNGGRILDGQIRNRVDGDDGDYFSKWFPGGYFATYSAADLGVSNTWNNNNTAMKDRARAFLGRLKRVSYDRIPDLTLRTYYEPLVHEELIDEIMTEGDNLVTGEFNERSFNLYRTFIPPEVDTNLGNRAIEVKLRKSGNILQRDGDNRKIYDVTYNEAEMVEQFERIKEEYRAIILNWIAAEHDARK